MKSLNKNIRAALLTTVAGLGMLLGSTQQSTAAVELNPLLSTGNYYTNYYINYVTYTNYVNYYSYDYNTYYLGYALPYLYYYWGCYYGDYYGYTADSVGAKSPTYKGSAPYWDYEYDYYAYYGDYYYHTY